MYISVIVPVYKVEGYLEDCLDSILRQTYRNFEIILVDDGSPDKCPSICDSYEKRFSNVRTIHKDNGGLSDARNCGVKIAKGDFITFIDSDDMVTYDYLEELVSIQERYGCDLCTVDCFIQYNKKGIKCRNKVSCLTGIKALERMLYQKSMDTHAWGLLIKKEIVEKYPFPVGKFHEDDFTTYHYYANSNYVGISSRKLYFYRQREDSIMHLNLDACRDELDASDFIVEDCKNKYRFALNAAKSKQFSNYCQVYLKYKAENDVDEDTLSRIEMTLNKLKYHMLLNPKVRLKNKVGSLLFLINPKLYVFINSKVRKKV